MPRWIAAIAFASLLTDAIAGRPTQLVRPDPENPLQLQPTSEGLRLLRSSALASKPLLIVSVAGEARKGKSFFLNALLRETDRGPFAVSSSQEGVTKGMWVNVVDPGSGRSGPASRLWSPSASADPYSILLMDSEGIGAPQSTEEFDMKLVTLGGMVASTMLYNNLKDVNQDDVRSLYNMIQFDKFFKHERRHELVWLVQSYAKDPEIWPCERYPDVFLREQGTSSNESLTAEQKERHNTVVKHVRARGTRISCLPYPKKNPYVDDYKLPMVPYYELDIEYRARMDEIRSFLFERPVNTSALLKGAELADFLDLMVPRLNEITSALSEFLTFHAEKCEKSLEQKAESELAALVNSFSCDLKVEEFRKRCEVVRTESMHEFNACVLGDPHMRENTKVAKEFDKVLGFQVEIHRRQIDGKWDRCQPPPIFVVVRDYFVGYYFLCLDLVVPYILGKLLSWVLFWSPHLLSVLFGPPLKGMIGLAPTFFTSTREIFAVLAIIEYGPALGLPDLKALLLSAAQTLVEAVGVDSLSEVLPADFNVIPGVTQLLESTWNAWVTPWCNPVMRTLLSVGVGVVPLVLLAAVPRVFNFFLPLQAVQLLATSVFLFLQGLAERETFADEPLLLVLAVLFSGLVLFLPFADAYEDRKTAATFEVLGDKDVRLGKSAVVMAAGSLQELAACRTHCLAKGYSAFVVRGGRAYFQSANASDCRREAVHAVGSNIFVNLDREAEEDEDEDGSDTLGERKEDDDAQVVQQTATSRAPVEPDAEPISHAAGRSSACGVLGRSDLGLFLGAGDNVRRIIFWLWLVTSLAMFAALLLQALFSPDPQIPSFFERDVVSCAGRRHAATVDAAESMMCVLCDGTASEGTGQRMLSKRAAAAMTTVVASMLCWFGVR